MNYTISNFLLKIPSSIYACFGLIGGILLFLNAPLSWSLGFLIIGCTVLGFLCKNIKFFRCFLSFLILGWISTAYKVYPHNTFPYQLYQDKTSFTGTITNIHQTNQRLSKGITLFVNSLNMTIQLYVPKNTPGSVGDKIFIEDIHLKKTSKKTYQDYLLKEGILCTIFIENPKITVEHHPDICLSRIIYNLKKQLHDQIKSKCSYKTFCLYSVLFLGDKSGCKYYLENCSDQFKEWGITHYLARSGLHLVIFIILWELLCSLFPIHYCYKQWLLFLITTIYFVLSFPTVSFLRAFILFALYKLCILQYRPYHFMHALSSTCCIVLILNPMQLFFLDFQLTFILTGGLAWLSMIKDL